MFALLRKHLLSQSKIAGYITKILIVSIDLGFSLLAFGVALFIETGFALQQVWGEYLISWATVLLLAIRGMTFVAFKTYLVIIRYIGIRDLKRLFWAITAGSLAFGLVTLVFPSLLPTRILLSVILLDYFILLFLASGFRIFLRYSFDQIRQKKPNSRLNTVIYGAGEMGAILERVLRQGTSHSYQLVAIFDDNPRVHGKFLNGIPIFNLDESFDKVMQRFDVKVAVIGIKNLPDDRRINFINRSLAHKAKVLKVPPSTDWLSGRLNVSALRKVNFEDLLNRPVIKLSEDRIAESLTGKTVMVTGCAGSIGSEMVRQILRYRPRKLIGIDQAETPLAELKLELNKAYGDVFLPIIGDVRDEAKMDQLFERYQPQLVFHAAAYKHVPIMEAYPHEAIKANVKGTRTIARLASAYQVEKFVMVSTDKVVKPSSVMGASKRIAEIFVQSLNESEDNATQFITTRFGNVLGSNGSVIPIFKRQIESGQSVTVTHPEVTRFFMTIPEACQLVLEAGTMGQGGEIYVFDMGEPVRIADLAEKMIQMAGLNPGEDIDIVYTGLRPGEKLYEELLDQSENLKPTHHPKILCAAVRRQDYATARGQIDELIAMAEIGLPDDLLVTNMQALVPEYAPKNSNFTSTAVPARIAENKDLAEGHTDSHILDGQPPNGLRHLLLRTLGRVIPSDLFAHRFPISVKGICFLDDKVILLKNERGAWDLPGGKLKPGESLPDCLEREFEEELNIPVRVNALQRLLRVKVMDRVEVIVAVYGCQTEAPASQLKLSQENFAIGTFQLKDLNEINILPDYVSLIRQVFRQRKVLQMRSSA